MKLPGGWIQRTTAARMFVRSTELFVFDDLSSALDVDTKRMTGRRSSLTRRALASSYRIGASSWSGPIHIILPPWWMAGGCRYASGGVARLKMLRGSEEMRRLWEGNSCGVHRDAVEVSKGAT